MPYLGTVELKASDIRRIDITSSTSATHTLTWTAPNEQSLIVTINGVKQQNNYTVSGTTLTLDTALGASDLLEVIGINDVGTTITPAQGSVDTDQLANVAVTTAKLAADSVTSAKIVDGTVANADMADMAANTIKVRDANSSGVPSDKALATTEILIGDGTGFTAASLSGDATMTNAGAVTVTSIADNAVTLAKLEDGTQGDILYYGASGAPTRLGFGTSGDFLKTQGTGANPVWATIASATIQYFDSTIIASGSDTSTSATFISGGADITVPAATANTLSKIIVVGSGGVRCDGPASANMVKWRIERTAPSSVTSNVVTIGGAIGTGTEQYNAYYLLYVDESLSDADHTYEVQFKKDYATTVRYLNGGTNICVYGV